ncbi:MAG: N-acetylneuraminate synthase family protein [Thaumarchaeota archaeon]|nr:N-acetylneuraminate synthase family protein [Nitrososphaerota archaeon]MBI3641325.1 N-acetylneuraminate synthase family protein [Nitrososphaerota archaeon]
MKEIELNNHVIGHGKPPFIVAEVGINHNGEIEKAFKMIHLAKEIGVDAIKFQTFKADEFIADKKQMFTYKSQGKEITESMLEMFKRYEFSRDEWFKIKKKCDDEKILFLSTPQNRSDLNLLLELDIPAIKIGSDDFTNLPLLKDYSSTGLPIILSCGMSNLTEVYESLNTIGALDGYPTVLLLTTSQYPTPAKDVNLRKLETLSKEFPMIPLGLSDHTQGHLASSLAVVFGASVFEKHFTLDHNLPGPDHWFSEDPIGLKEWANSIKISFTMMGSNIIEPTQEEQNMKILARRSIVALCDIIEGEILSNENIGLRRPGNGLPASMIEQVLGMRAVRNINKGSFLKSGDFQ